MKKLLASVLSLALVLGLSMTASAQSFTFNKTTIVGNGNQVTNLNQGGLGGFAGPVSNQTMIQGNFNKVTNANFGLVRPQPVYQPVYRPVMQPVCGTGLIRPAPPVPFQSVAPVSPFRSTVNSTFIQGSFNTVNNINQ